MNSGLQFLKVISIRVVLGACALLTSVVCSAQDISNFTTDTVFNLTDTTQATILITANWGTAVQAQISYLGRKLDQPPFPEVQIGEPINIPPGRTRTFNIDLNHPAFNGGYGAVRVRSVDISGAPSAVPFFAYLRESDGEVLSAISGNHLTGAQFYIPTINGRSQRLRIIVTSMGARGISTVTIRSTNGYDSTVFIPVGATFRWDSEELPNGQELSNGSIWISTPSALVVSIYYEQVGPFGSTRKYHVHLPASAN